jgi:hypothetical protein
MIEIIEGPVFDIQAGGYRKSLIIVLRKNQTFKDRGDVLLFQLDKIFKGRNQKRWRLIKRMKLRKEKFISKVIPFFKLTYEQKFQHHKMSADEIIEMGNIKSLDIIDQLKYLDETKKS